MGVKHPGRSRHTTGIRVEITHLEEKTVPEKPKVTTGRQQGAGSCSPLPALRAEPLLICTEGQASGGPLPATTEVAAPGAVSPVPREGGS